MRLITPKLAVLVLTLSLTGCVMWESIDDRLPDWFARSGSVSSSKRIAEVLRATGTEHDGILYSVWMKARPALNDSTTDSNPRVKPYRWDYPALTALMLSELEPTADDFMPFVEDEDPNVATAAAIAVTRYQEVGLSALSSSPVLSSNCFTPQPVVDRLSATIGNINLQTNLRCAAAEALSRIDKDRATTHVRDLLDRYGKLDSAGRQHLTYRGEVAAELLEGLASLAHPTEDQRLIDGLSSEDQRVKLVAARAWHATDRARTDRIERFPAQLVRLRFDSSIPVRAAAVRALARRDDPESIEYLRHALMDMHVDVRRAAVEGLADIGDIESRGILVEAMGRQSETIRASIVSALAKIEAWSDVLDAVRDRSWRVRKEVAHSLKDYHKRPAQVVAVEMLADPSIEVQRTILESAGHWPMERAGHFLLTAMEATTPSTRDAAAARLAEFWEPAASFTSTAPIKERQRQIAELRQAYISRFGPPSIGAATVEPLVAPPQLSEQELDRLAIELRDRNASLLERRGEALVQQLEQLTAARRAPLPEYVYDKVLPRVSPVFEHIDALGHGTDFARRIAAGRLEQAAREKPLGRLATERICRIATGTTDPIVWTRLVDAVAEDWSEPSIRLTLLAAGHRSLEVRRRACRKLGRSGDRRHVDTLIPALTDPSREVIIDAARAIAELCDPSGIGPAMAMIGTREDEDYNRRMTVDALERLIGHSDVAVRLAAADALNRLNESSGSSELQRLSYNADAGTRMGVIRSMRACPRADFTRTIVRLLDDRASIRRAALEALPTIAAADPLVASMLERSPEATGVDTNDDRKKAELWKAWYDHAAGG